MFDETEKLRERCEAYKGQVEAGSALITKLRAFAKEVIEFSWAGSIDGGDIQEIAEKHDLTQPEIYDPEKHGDNVDAVPGEDTIYVMNKEVMG